jgi:hypothetical protein
MVQTVPTLDRLGRLWRRPTEQHSSLPRRVGGLTCPDLSESPALRAGNLLSSPQNGWKSPYAPDNA